jgi:hypothetical protein
MKAFYKVVKIVNGDTVCHSKHQNWDYAEVQRDLQRKKGLACFITYKGKMVEKDVKKISKLKGDI